MTLKHFPFIPIAIAISIFYWIYLAFTTAPVIVHDAASYETLGEMIHDKGFDEYLRTGPNREPLYPLLVSFSMTIGNILPASYKTVQVLFQFFFLFLTQLFSFLILKKLNVKESIAVAAILYLGISPAMINASVSIFSEVAAFPSIAGIILISLYVWPALQSNSRKDAVKLGCGTALLFLLATLVKGVYQNIFALYVLLFVCLSVISLLDKNKNLCVQAALFVLAAVLTFHVFMVPYKMLNKKYNGVYAYTDTRGAAAFYGGAVIRTEPFTSKKLLTSLANIPGHKYCQAAFSEEECRHLSTKYLENVYGQKTGQLSTQVSKDKEQAALLSAAKEEILKHPVQYAVFTGIDFIKMFFWESTEIGFVAYPGWIESLHNFPPIKHSFRFITSILGLIASFYMTIFVFKSRKLLMLPSNGKDMRVFTVFCILLLIYSHLILYSIASATISRHAFPVAPLLILIIAVFFDQKLTRN